MMVLRAIPLLLVCVQQSTTAGKYYTNLRRPTYVQQLQSFDVNGYLLQMMDQWGGGFRLRNGWIGLAVLFIKLLPFVFLTGLVIYAVLSTHSLAKGELSENWSQELAVSDATRQVVQAVENVQAKYSANVN